MIKVENKNVVVPGEVLAEGMEYLPSYGTFRYEDKIISKIVGLVSVDGKVIKIIPLNGKYMPKKGDTVIGKIVDILMAGWRLDLNCTNTAILPPQEASSSYIERGSDLTQYFNFGDYLVCKITNVTTQGLIDVSVNGPGLRKVIGGRIITVGSHKVPRIIGKQGSMINLIKNATGSTITVGQNGVVWIKNNDPDKELITVQAIRLIEENSHISGLTDKVTEFLKSNNLM